MKIKVPAVQMLEISGDEFIADVVKQFLPATEPKFALKQLVMFKGAFGRDMPAVVLSISSSISGWMYDVARPRLADGVIDRVGATEKSLRPLTDDETSA